MKLYRYIFYVLLRWARRNENIELAKETAFVTITALVFFNFLSFFGNLDLFFKIDFIDKIVSLNKFQIVLLLITISTPQYFILKYNKKYLKIIAEFKNETKKQRLKGNIITTFYIIGSLLWLFLTVYIKMMKNRGVF